VAGKVWVTETGGIVRAERWPYDEERARLSLGRALSLAEAHPDRIERVFIYQWRAAPSEPWDAGLLRPDGTPRPSYAVLADYVGAPVPPTEVRLADGSPATPGPPPRTGAAARLARLPRANRRGVVSARVACPVAAARSCAARLSVRTRLFRGRRQGLGTDAKRILPGTTATLSVRLPAARRRLIRLGRTTSVVARVQAGWHRAFIVRCPR
jgi:hypothetical protein